MTLTGIDQSWIADIIYIRMDMEFVYLAVLIDAFSRRVIGWALDRHLEDDLAIAALELAFRCRAPYSAPKYKRRLRPSTVQMAERFAAPFLLSAEEPVWVSLRREAFFFRNHDDRRSARRDLHGVL